jgi:hypothetical protein
MRTEGSRDRTVSGNRKEGAHDENMIYECLEMAQQNQSICVVNIY